MSDLLLAFYGDDFIGSTDALETLTRAGVSTVLFTRPPTAADLARHPAARAIGVAGQTRTMTVDETAVELRPALECLRDSGAGVVHYKVRSTFDSSPTVGNIGRVMELGLKVFDQAIVPVVVGAPALGRHCVFGNLFARVDGGSERTRLDRHPTISKHPATPMTESDLRRHLQLQSLITVGLLDVLALDRTWPLPKTQYETVCQQVKRGGVLIDLLTDTQLQIVGSLLADKTRRFVVGSSGVESALCAAWVRDGLVTPPAPQPAIGDAGPIVVVSGSDSPVTAGQIREAIAGEFTEVVLSPNALETTGAVNSAVLNAVAFVTHALEAGRSVVLHTDADHRADHGPADDARLGESLGHTLKLALDRRPVKRVVIAGGDTAGRVVRALDIDALQMIAALSPGAPLCRASAKQPPVDGLQIVLKDSQIGPPDFFARIRNGRADLP